MPGRAHLDPYEAQGLIAPYVYGDREGAPGTMSVATAAQASPPARRFTRARPAIQ